MEAKVAQLEEEISNHGGGVAKRGKEDALPRAPEKYTLSGHRNSINAVRFHPVFSLAASASEDATIKVCNETHQIIVNIAFFLWRYGIMRVVSLKGL